MDNQGALKKVSKKTLSKDVLKLILTIIILLILIFVLLRPSALNIPTWTDRENNLYQIAIAITLLFMGTYLGRIISSSENIKSATSAFRRILDIERVVNRQFQLLSKLGEEDTIIRSDIGILLEQNYSLADTIKSSRLDWSDIIGEVIINTDRILELENSKILYLGDTKKIAQLSSEIAQLKERLPYAIKAGISPKPSLPQMYIVDTIVDFFKKTLNDEHKLILNVRSIVPDSFLKGILDKHPPLEFRFTLRDSMFWLDTFAGDNFIGVVSLPPNDLTDINLTDISYSIQFIIRMYCQSISENPDQYFDNRHLIINDYEYSLNQNSILSIIVPVKGETMLNLLRDMPG